MSVLISLPSRERKHDEEMEEDKKWWSKVKFVFVAAAKHKRIKLFTGFSSESSDGSKNDLAKFSHSSLLQIPLLHSHLSASSFVFSDDETSLIHFRCKKPSRSGVGRVRPKKNKRKKNRNNDKAVCNVEELYEQRVPSVFTAFCFNFLTTPEKSFFVSLVMWRQQMLMECEEEGVCEK